MGAPAMVMIIVFMHVSVAEGAMWAHHGGNMNIKRDAECTAGRKEHL
jgi:hypothetical protein